MSNHNILCVPPRPSLLLSLRSPSLIPSSPPSTRVSSSTKSLPSPIQIKMLMIQKPESHTVAVKSGWKKGTKIIFESMGTSANFVFLISEKRHPSFKRVGNDLVLKLTVSLANALAGWSFSFMNLDGERISCLFHDEIISHGYEKVIKGKGMSTANQNGTRGDLRIKFHVVFPRKLSEEQTNIIVELLADGK